MEDYPKTLEEFEARFSTEEACRDYLFKLRWPNGFRCPRCGNGKAWPVGEILFQCTRCNFQMPVITGTIFKDTHKPLSLWFRAIWWVTGQKNGASTLSILKYRIEFFKFNPSILVSKSPDSFYFFFIAFYIPCFNFTGKLLPVFNTSIQTLPA